MSEINEEHPFLTQVKSVLATLTVLLFTCAYRLYERLTIFKVIIFFVLLYMYYAARKLRLVILIAERDVAIGLTDIDITIDEGWNAISYALNKGVGGIEKVVTFGTHSGVNIPKLNLIKRMGFLNDMLNMKKYCDASNSISTEMLFILKSALNNTVCAVLRYIQPLTPIYLFMDLILGWIVFNPDPESEGFGCKIPTHAEQCMLANCYRLIEFVLIVFISYNLFMVFLPLIRYIFVNGIWNPVHKAFHTVYTELHTQITKIR